MQKAERPNFGLRGRKAGSKQPSREAVIRLSSFGGTLMSFHFIRKRIPIVLLLLTIACDGLPIPRIVFDTPTPPPIGPTATPLPTSIISFVVHLPANTPIGYTPAVKLIDDVGGTSINVSLTSSGNNVWIGGTTAATGTVLRYRHIRSTPVYVEEATAAREPVPYRLLHVNSANMTVEDTVAAWTDTPFAGNLGGLVGTVRNSNTGQGVMGVIVSAGGKLTLTAWDGSYLFFDLPAGLQRVTVLAPDGSLRPVQNTATVVAGQMAPLDLVTSDPNAVHVTFLTRTPPNTDSSAVLRLAGNVSQMGNMFALDPSGSGIAAARQPQLVQLGDGRWGTQVLLYEGTVVRYKYTLGDGVWDGELDSGGGKRLRQFIVPASNATIEDQIVSWHTGVSANVVFEVTTPANTPPGDTIAIQFRTNTWLPPVPMWRVGVNNWKFVLYNPTNFSGNVFYRYCRNYACGGADDAATAGPNSASRFFTPTLLQQDLKDTVTQWQWSPDLAAPGGIVPAVNPHPGFAAGIEFIDEWNPNWIPFYGETFRSLQAMGANWVTFTPRGSAQMSPVPLYANDLALAPHPSEWKPLVDQAHNSGLRVALHPVTCHYTPYGPCDYWNGVSYTPEFWNAWFAAYEKYLITQAEIATRAGADLLVIGDFKLRPSFPGEPEAPPDADARWRSLSNNVRAHFRGPIAFDLLMGQNVWPNPPSFLDVVDVIRVFWWSPLSSGNAPTVNEIANNAGSLLDTQVLPSLQRFQRGVIIVAGYYSADGAATQCLRREDGACHSYEAFNPNAPDVTRYSVDLQEQADVYNGLLTAINTRSWVAGLFSFGYNPVVALRDKSISVRGKPAEAVLAAWYPRLQGR
jgi:hypothetical protein